VIASSESENTSAPKISAPETQALKNSAPDMAPDVTPDVAPGLYRHYKDKMYRVIGTARHSETLEKLVVYEALYENDLGKLWVRPAAMFAETVSVSGQTVPRFQRITE